jgi:hypothetical protein
MTRWRPKFKWKEAVMLNTDCFVATRDDGSLWQATSRWENTWHGPGHREQFTTLEEREMSSNYGWIGAGKWGDNLLTLHGDGILCKWRDPYDDAIGDLRWYWSSHSSSGWMRPTRLKAWKVANLNEDLDP